MPKSLRILCPPGLTLKIVSDMATTTGALKFWISTPLLLMVVLKTLAPSAPLSL